MAYLVAKTEIEESTGLVTTTVAGHMALHNDKAKAVNSLTDEMMDARNPELAAPEETATSVPDLLGQLKEMLKNITGETNWFDGVATTLASIVTDIAALVARFPVVTGDIADSAVTYPKLDLSDIPRAKARLNSNQTIETGTAGEVIVFNNEVYDVGDCWDSGNGDRFTAPEDGLYVFSGAAVFLASATNRMGARVMKNGGQDEDYQDITDAGDMNATKAINWYWEGELSVGDYVSINIFQDSGGSRDIQANRVFGRFRKVAE